MLTNAYLRKRLAMLRNLARRNTDSKSSRTKRRTKSISLVANWIAVSLPRLRVVMIKTSALMISLLDKILLNPSNCFN